MLINTKAVAMVPAAMVTSGESIVFNATPNLSAIIDEAADLEEVQIVAAESIEEFDSRLLEAKKIINTSIVKINTTSKKKGRWGAVAYKCQAAARLLTETNISIEERRMFGQDIIDLKVEARAIEVITEGSSYKINLEEDSIESYRVGVTDESSISIDLDIVISNQLENKHAVTAVGQLVVLLVRKDKTLAKRYHGDILRFMTEVVADAGGDVKKLK